MTGRMRRFRGPGLLSLALLLVGAMAVLSSQLHGPIRTRAGITAGEVSAHLPHAIRGDLRAPTSIAPGPTPTPTLTVAPPTSEPTPTVPSDRDYVLLQVATYGGAAPDTMFGVDRIRMAPWFIVYADGAGHGGRALVVPHDSGLPDRSQLLQFDLDAPEVERIVSKLVDEAEFWDVPEPDHTGLCVPDLDTTAVLLQGEPHLQPEQSRTLYVYGLDWYLRGTAPCRPGDGTPVPPDPRLVKLAQFVDDLRVPPADARPYPLDRAVLVVARDLPGGDAPTWPLEHDLAAMAPAPLESRLHDLEAEDIAPAMAAVAEARQPGWTMARFAHGEERFVVGVRAEPPLWWVYGPEIPGGTGPQCPRVAPKCTPGPSPTPCNEPACPTPVPCPCRPRVECPPNPPRCTPGPRPTMCVGPGCPTPDPCPCDP